MRGSSFFDHEADDRTRVWFYLRCYHATCSTGRPRKYWLDAAQRVAVGRVGLQREFAQVWARALQWGEALTMESKR